MPPGWVLDPKRETPVFAPAHDLMEWARERFLLHGGAFWNPDHQHLQEALIGILWTDLSNEKGDKVIAGTAEIPAQMGASKWVKGRMLYQLEQWFGEIPDFLITLDAGIWAGANDASACGLLDHELYHCGQRLDREGEPLFDLDDKPVWTLNPHDAEEFVGVVARWGVPAAAAGVAELVRAAGKPPQFSGEAVALGCGSCR